MADKYSKFDILTVHIS